mmetsp:Transcript_9273/g.24495  ORF Transcript_9273/g.24495 Transcript_9273/m.24495 type:complete len:102 (+) Transcript_9273:319-624(+)
MPCGGRRSGRGREYDVELEGSTWMEDSTSSCMEWCAANTMDLTKRFGVFFFTCRDVTSVRSAAITESVVSKKEKNFKYVVTENGGLGYLPAVTSTLQIQNF